ncbi:MAG: hypothetical protein QXP81_10275 [Nitrososphaerota archaeon]
MVGELIKKILSERPLLGRIRSQLIGPATGEIIDSGLEKIVDDKKREWIARGVSPRLADMAADLARGWAERVSRWHISLLKDVLPPEELRAVERRILERYLREGLDRVAEEWIRAISA